MNRPTFKQTLLRWRRRLAMRLGDTRYCKVGSWKLIEELFLSNTPGTFVEAGAHDGWTGSNTYWLEAELGWRGILIEPVPGLYQACRKERPKAKVFHGALVDAHYPHSTIDIECSGLVSTIKDSAMSEETMKMAKGYYSVESRPTVSVPALTLNACLKLSGFSTLDFLSLDVEGFEAQALGGINFDEWKPLYLLVECNDEPSVLKVLSDRYTAIERFPSKDVLFRRTN